MLDEIIQTIPAGPGTYALWLHLPQSKNLTIGKLGNFLFPAGDYVYLGSARGPGGLRARLGRHLRGDGKIRWHIDYLRVFALVYGFGLNGATSKECIWSQKLTDLPNAKIAVPGFGASDCQSGCTAHLVHFSTVNPDQIANLLRCEIRILDRE